MENIFVCYHDEDSDIFEVLKNECMVHNIKIIVSRNNTSNIVKNISKCSVFVLILSNHVVQNMQFLKQIKIAYKLFVEEKMEFIVLQRSEEVSLWEGFNYVERNYKINICSGFDNSALSQVVERIKYIIRKSEIKNNGGALESFKSYHYNNEYIMKTFDKNRVEIQQKLLKKIEQPIYDRIFETIKNKINILNIGSGYEKLIMDRIKNKNCINKFIGINVKRTGSTEPKEMYGFNANFYTMNCENSDFTVRLMDIVKQENIDKFDIVVLSMVLLHLKAPYIFLKNIRSFVKQGGKIIILDIDDGLNIAYPDRFHDFERVFQICDYCEKSGYRKGGRELFTYLSKVGMKNISLELLGISTMGMTFEEREQLFDVYFNFIPEVIEDMLEKYPENQNIQDDYNWINTRFTNIMEQFYETDFFFVLGFMIVTAER